MITDSFDNSSEAIASPNTSGNRIHCDICIATFSNIIEQYIVDNYGAKQVGEYKCVNGVFPIYIFDFEGKKIGLYKTLLGAPASVGCLEDVTEVLDVNKFLVFGAAGSLDKNQCHGKIVVPTFAYRDEGTSYHYAPPSDYIEIKNAQIVADFMQKHGVPYVMGKCWTTDAFYRETRNNFDKRKKDGCVVVDMECSAMQAVCNHRGFELYYFLVCGDLLDAPKWTDDGLHDANHNLANVTIAIHLAKDL